MRLLEKESLLLKRQLLLQVRAALERAPAACKLTSPGRAATSEAADSLTTQHARVNSVLLLGKSPSLNDLSTQISCPRARQRALQLQHKSKRLLGSSLVNIDNIDGYTGGALGPKIGHGHHLNSRAAVWLLLLLLLHRLLRSGGRQRLVRPIHAENICGALQPHASEPKHNGKKRFKAHLCTDKPHRRALHPRASALRQITVFHDLRQRREVRRSGDGEGDGKGAHAVVQGQQRGGGGAGVTRSHLAVLAAPATEVHACVAAAEALHEQGAVPQAVEPV